MTADALDAYAAGVVDSDGCITIKRRRYRDGDRWRVAYSLNIIVAQVGDHGEPPVLALLRERYGGSTQRRAEPSKRTMWHWSVATRQAETALRRIAPFLIGKQEEARVALEYRDVSVNARRPDLADGFYRQLRSLKSYNPKREDP